MKLTAFSRSHQATKNTVEHRVSELLESLTKEDRFLMYYAGYGFAEVGNTILSCSDSVLKKIGDTGVPIAQRDRRPQRHCTERGSQQADLMRPVLPLPLRSSTVSPLELAVPSGVLPHPELALMEPMLCEGVPGAKR